MNVAVINLKYISKNFFKIVFGTMVLIVTIKLLIGNIKLFQKIFTFENCSIIYTGFFENNQDLASNDNYLYLFKDLCPIIVAMNGTQDEVLKQIVEEPIKKEDILISKNANIESVSERNIAENYNITYENVKIKNESDYELTEDIFSQDDFELTNTKKILIYHTHTCESYTPSENYNYTMTGNYRTTDNNYNVVRLGEELTKYLNQKGIEVIHDTSYHDYPSYSGSYERSLETIQGILNENQDIEIVIDLHRDAVGDGASYGPTVKIDGQSVAQLMLVVGTDGGGLEHPNWKQNVKTAMKIQKTANSIYPRIV